MICPSCNKKYKKADDGDYCINKFLRPGEKEESFCFWHVESSASKRAKKRYEKPFCKCGKPVYKMGMCKRHFHSYQKKKYSKTRGYKVSPEMIERMRKLKSQGVTVNDIARRFGIAPTTAGRYINRGTYLRRNKKLKYKKD